LGGWPDAVIRWHPLASAGIRWHPLASAGIRSSLAAAKDQYLIDYLPFLMDSLSIAYFH